MTFEPHLEVIYFSADLTANLLNEKIKAYLDSIGYTEVNDTHTIYKIEKSDKVNPERVYESKVFARSDGSWDFLDGDKDVNDEDKSVRYFLRVRKVDDKFDKNQIKAIIKSVEPNPKAYSLGFQKLKAGVKVGIDYRVVVKFHKTEL